jgi:dihydrofolate reductase
MSLIGIAACTKDGIIGINDAIPWHYKEDFAFFKFMTSGHTVVMGGRTYRGIGKPLPNRKNVVISRKGGENKENIEFIDIGDEYCMKAIESYLFENEDIYICGGSEIYNMFFDNIDKWIITTVIDELPSGGFTAKIDIEKIKANYKKLAEIKLSDKCSVIKYDKMLK